MGHNVISLDTKLICVIRYFKLALVHSNNVHDHGELCDNFNIEIDKNSMIPHTFDTCVKPDPESFGHSRPVAMEA